MPGSRGSQRPALMVARAALFLLGSMTSMIAGLVLARRLSPAEYAAMQSLTKRVIQYVAMTSILYESWLIRDTVRGAAGLRGSLLLYGALSAGVGSISGAGLVYALTGNAFYAALAGVAGGLLGARAVLGTILDAVRPVRAPLVVLGGRLVYLGGVLWLVERLRLGLLGALASFLARTLFMVAGLGYYAAHIIREASRTAAGKARATVERARASMYRLFSYLLPNIDVPLVLALARSDMLISGFFAARLIPFTLLDITRNTFRFLQAAFSRGWTPREAMASVRVTLLLASPILMFSLVYSTHVLCLVNCEYAWASRMLELFSVEAALLLVAVSLENIYLGIAAARESEKAHARAVEKLYRSLLPAYLLYPLTLLAIPLATDSPPARGLVWAVGVLLMTVATNTVLASMLSREIGPRRVVGLYSWTLAYLLVSLLLALPPWVHARPRRGFFQELLILAPPAIAYYLVAVLALLAIDGEARSILLAAARARIGRRAG